MIRAEKINQINRCTNVKADILRVPTSSAPTIEFDQASYQVREPPGPDGVEALNIKVIRHGDLDRTSKIRCSTRDGSAQSGVDYNPNSRVLKFTPGEWREPLMLLPVCD